MVDAEHNFDDVMPLHIGAEINTTTIHVIIPSGGNDEFLYETAEYLRHHFNIHHVTIQIE